MPAGQDDTADVLFDAYMEGVKSMMRDECVIPEAHGEVDEYASDYEESDDGHADEHDHGGWGF